MSSTRIVREIGHDKSTIVRLIVTETKTFKAHDEVTKTACLEIIQPAYEEDNYTVSTKYMWLGKQEVEDILELLRENL